MYAFWKKIKEGKHPINIQAQQNVIALPLTGQLLADAMA